MTPILGIVTVVKDRAEGLERTLASIHAQSANNGELHVVIVDGASTDRTVEVATAFVDHFKHAVCISEPDEGIYDAMNKGWERSPADYILFLNAGDCLADAGVVVDVINVLRSERPAWLVARTAFTDAAGIQVRVSDTVPHHFWRHAYGLRMHAHPSCVFARSLIASVNGYACEFGHAADFDLVLRVGRLSHPAALDRVVAVFEEPGVSALHVRDVPDAIRRIRLERLGFGFGWRIADAAYSNVFRRRWLKEVERRARA